MNLSLTPFAPLAVHLLDLLRQLGDDVQLTLAGGFGLFLRREWIAELQTPTLLQPIPEARATEDFDLLLSLELLTDAAKASALKKALDDLGYEVLPNAHRFQFKKTGTAWEQARDVKVDLLAPIPPADHEVLTADAVRVKRKKGSSALHGRVTPEAIAVEEHLVEIGLEGECSDNQFYQGHIWLPNTFTLYVMKLFAFRDRQEGKRGNPEPDYAGKHAADLYTLTALLRQEDYDAALQLAQQYREHPITREASTIVEQYFGDETSAGVLHIREQLNPEAENLQRFLAVLNQVFARP